MRVFLDTDIATDVDDALALAVLLGSPEVELLGVSTVYGDTQLRARYAAKIISLISPGLEKTIPIGAGRVETMSGKAVWWAGHEGDVFSDLAEFPAPTNGLELLVKTAAAHPGELDVLAIAPLTNIAAALEMDPEFATNVRRVVIMGGDFRSEKRTNEHNFESDVVAAQKVFASDLTLVMGGLDLTKQVRLEEQHRVALASSGELGRVLQHELGVWWDVWGDTWGNPHDPILAVWMLEPQLFETTQEFVEIDEDGYSNIVAEGRRQVTVIRKAQSEAVLRSILRRIHAAPRR